MPFFSDTFTEGSDTALSSHTPDVGTSWTQVYSDDGVLYKIQSTLDTLMQDKAGLSDRGCFYTANATYPSANYQVKITMKSRLEAGGQSFIIARYQDIENMYVATFQGTTANTGRLYKKVSGTWTALGSDYTAPANDSVVTFEVFGTSIKLYDDGSLIQEVTDSDISAAGKAGIGGGGGPEAPASGWDMATFDASPNVSFDDFSVSEIFTVSIADSVTATDTKTAYRGLVKSIIDTITASDTISALITTIWTALSKVVATVTGSNKNSATMTAQSKNSATMTPEDKSGDV